MDYKENTKNTKELICEKCDFKCSRHAEYSRHLLTAKHIRITKDAENAQKNTTIYKCICGNEYKHRQNLHRHKKLCVDITDANYKNKSTFTKVEQNVQSIMALSNFY